MASTERSMGWATSGTGDGIAGGYDSSRWRANAQKTDGSGVTLFGSYLAMSGVSTSTLTIADGAALINGYTYETVGSVTISTGGLTGTYNVIVVANSTLGTVTVTQTGAGGTTIAASTTRAAIATAAQTTTIQGLVTTAQVLILGTITVSAGVIGSITPAYPYANTLTLPAQIFGLMDSTAIINIPNTTTTDINGYTNSLTSGDGVITLNTTTGTFTVAIAGLYHFDVRCTWDSNATGSRILSIGGTGFAYTLDSNGVTTTASTLTYGLYMQYSGLVYLNAGATVTGRVNQNSGGTRTINNGSIKLSRV